ncbi:MAG: DUF4403 family protein [Holophagaceae bacterium]|nr:DUF4403 family protein [Holophagaceae bacterium]
MPGPRHRTGLRALALAGCALGALQAQAPQGTPAFAAGLEPPVSQISLPVRVDISAVLNALEGNIPRTPPGVDTWAPLPDRPDYVYRFSLYRDAIQARAEGDRIVVRTLAHYWIQVGARVFGPFVKTLASCGVGKEGHRAVILGAEAEVFLTPGWHLAVRPRALDPLPVSRCEMTFLGLNATGPVMNGMKGALVEAARNAEVQLRESTFVRSRAKEAWEMAQKPIPVAEGVWLLLRPERVRLGRPMADPAGDGRILLLRPELQARPMLVLGPPPSLPVTPLPALDTAPASGSGVRVALESDLPFQQASEQLGRQLAGRKFETDQGSFEIVSASVRGAGGKALIEVELKGRANGKVALAGRPVYDSALGTLRVEDLDYTFESRSWIENTAEWLLRSSLKRLLQERANLFLDQSFKGLKELLQLALNRPLATGIQLKGTVSELHLGQVRVLEDRFRVDAFLDGQFSLEVTALPLGR